MKFSLVIPVALDRDAEILSSIEKLDFPKPEFEVIVVKGKNPSENRNKGTEKARGKFIVFLDDDAVLDRDYLGKVEEFFEKNRDIDIVGGPQLTPKDDIGFAKISGYALSSKFGAWKISNRYSAQKLILDADETMLTSANLVCKNKVLKKIKFDLNLFPGEDPKFISDAQKQGFKIAYSPDIIVYHRRRANLKALIKQIFSYGKTRPIKESFLETLKMPFFFIPSIFVIYLFLLLILILSNSIITGSVIGLNNETETKDFYFLIFLPLFAYILIALFFSIYDSIINKDYKSILVLLFIYPIIHISYGSGMIYGYLKNTKNKK